MPTWVDIPAFDPSQLLTTADAERLRLNQDFLRNPPYYLYTRGFGDVDYMTTSAVFVDIDATNMKETLITFGGDVRISFSARVLHSGTGYVAFDFLVDGVSITNDATNGMGRIKPDSGEDYFMAKRLVLAAGSHIFTAQWNTSGGTATLDKDSLIQFAVIEKL